MPLLQWLNDDEARRAAQSVPYRLINTEASFGDPDAAKHNLLIQGDNLDALRALLPLYKGKVKCVYIDPPYNTGSAFEHYDDNLEHSQWLSMMLPRLQLLREFLADEGSIWVQIDDDEGAYLQVLMDEVFGRRNFITAIAVKMSHLSGVKMSHVGKTIPKLKETILIYSKCKESFSLNPVFISSDWDSVFDRYKSFLLRDEGDPENIQKWSVIPLGEAARRNGVDVRDREAYDKFRLSNAKNIFRTARNTSEPFLALPSDNVFRYVKTGSGILRLAYKREEVIFCSDRLKCINGVDVPAQPLGDIWTDIGINNLHNEGGVDFKNGKKPEKLIERVFQYATNPGDLVLDAFLGSGSTAAVAHKMGRRYIGIEMGEHARTHCLKRLQMVIEGEAGGISKSVDWKGGGGFTFCTLGENVFDKYGLINPDVSFETLAAFIWLNETHEPAPAVTSPFLGVHAGTGYYVLYEDCDHPTELNARTLQVLLEAHPFEGPKVIYAESCTLGAQTMKAHQVTFKQIPTDING